MKAEAELPKFKLNPHQAKLWDDTTHKILVGIAGAQGGKTSLGCRWIMREFWSNLHKGYNYVVVTPTYKIMQQSVIPTWVAVSKHLGGELNKADNFYPLPDGGKVYFRSATDPDAVIGTPNVKAAWIDECGKVSRAAYYAVIERVARLEGKVLLTTTPYSLGWLAREVIMPAERGQRDDILYVRWRSVDNPTFPQSAWDDAKSRLPSRVFRMRYEGYHDKAEGMIHDHWDDLNVVSKVELPQGTKYVGGIDWGWDHPFALVVLAITPDQNVTIVSILKRSNLTVSQVMDQIKAKTNLFGVKMWGCGHDRPEMIAELHKYRIPAVKYFEFDTNMREVRAGDQKVSELIFQKRLKIDSSIDQYAEFDDEIQTYVWDKDEDEDRGKEKPVDTNNDLMSALRYATIIASPMLNKRLEVPAGQKPSTLPRDLLNIRKKKSHWAAY